MAKDQTVADMNIPESAKAQTEPVTEIEHPEAPVTPIGEIYKAALAKEEGKESPKKAPKPAKEEAPKPKNEPEAKKGEEIPPKIEKQPTKPSSALDAALGDKPVEVKKDEPEAEPEVLKEFPKDAKKPNWERAREVMGKQAKEKGELQAEKERLERELADAKAQTGKLDPEIEKKLKENEEMRDAMTALNLKGLPEYRKEFIDDRKTLITEASNKLTAYGGDSQALIEALSMPEGRRKDEAIEAAFGEEVTEVGKAKIRNIIAEIEAKDEKARKLENDPQNSFESYQGRVTARKAKEVEEANLARSSEIGNVIKSLPELSPLLKPADPSMPDAKEWNEDLEKIVVAVPKDLGPDATLKDSAILSAKGRRFDFVAKKLTETYAELQTAKRQLAEFDTAQPEAKGNGAPKETGVEAELKKSPGEIYKETMARQQGNPIDA